MGRATTKQCCIQHAVKKVSLVGLASPNKDPRSTIPSPVPHGNRIRKHTPHSNRPPQNAHVLQSPLNGPYGTPALAFILEKKERYKNETKKPPPSKVRQRQASSKIHLIPGGACATLLGVIPSAARWSAGDPVQHRCLVVLPLVLHRPHALRVKLRAGRRTRGTTTSTGSECTGEHSYASHQSDLTPVPCHGGKYPRRVFGYE